MKKNIFIITLFLLLGFFSNSFASNDQISVMINDEKVNFNGQSPVIVSGRVLVPLKEVFEKLGKTVTWIGSEKKITIENEDTLITLFIDDLKMTIVEKIFNNIYIATLEVAPTIISGRTMVPLGAISAALGTDITWNQRAVYIKTIPKTENSNISAFIIDNVELNFLESKDSMLQKLGQPSRIDDSQNSYKWYIYNNDFSKYIQIGILNEKIVAFYSNSPKFSYKGITSTTSKSDASKIFDVSEDPNKLIGSDYLSRTIVYLDAHNNSIVDAVLVMLKEATMGSFNTNEDVLLAFEQQIFDLTNVIRVKNDLSVLEWDEVAAVSARKHSKDMGEHNYFDHYNLDGKSPFDRMTNEGISYQYAAENICAGQQNGFEAYSDWINSAGHRKNILNDNLSRLGVGTSVEKDKIHYTQNFYTP